MRGWLAAAGINGFTSIAMGALSAHLLQGRISTRGIDLVDTAARYQMYHALALFGTAWLVTVKPGIVTHLAGFAFLIGTILFSGGLYGLGITGLGGFAALAPFGGIAFMLGWLVLIFAAVRN